MPLLNAAVVSRLFDPMAQRGAQRVYSGVDAVKAADVVMRDQSNREQWPYMHVYPPVNAEPVHVIGTALVPTKGSAAIVLSYPVPSGFRFYLRSTIQTTDSVPVFVAGDATWTIYRNTLPGGFSYQGQPEQGLVAVPVRVGSFAPFAPDKFARCYEFEPLDVVQSIWTNVNLTAAVVPADGVLVAGFFGYLVPDVGKR